MCKGIEDMEDHPRTLLLGGRYRCKDSTSALQKIKLKKNTNSMKILSNLPATEVMFKKTLGEERKTKVLQNCA